MEVERCPLWRDKVTLVEKEIKIECVKGSDPHAVIEVESTSNEDVYGRIVFGKGPITSFAKYYTIKANMITRIPLRVKDLTLHLRSGETHIFKVWVCPKFGDAFYSFDNTPVEICLRGAVVFPRVDVKGEVSK